MRCIWFCLGLKHRAVLDFSSNIIDLESTLESSTFQDVDVLQHVTVFPS